MNDSGLHRRLATSLAAREDLCRGPFAEVPVEINGILQPMSFIGYSDWLPVNKGTQRSRPLILFFSFFFQVVPVLLLPPLFDLLRDVFFVVGDSESGCVGGGETRCLGQRPLIDPFKLEDCLPVNKGTQRSRPLLLFFSFFFQVVPGTPFPTFFHHPRKVFSVVGVGNCFILAVISVKSCQYP